MKIPVHHNPGSSPESPAADLQADQRIASKQNDDLAGLPTPKEGYRWVKVEFGVAFQKSKIQAGDVVLNVEPECDGIIEVARQLPVEPEPEVIFEWMEADPSWGCNIRVFDNGEGEWQSADGWMGMIQQDAKMACEIASLYAENKAKDALLAKFVDLGERVEKWVEWLDDPKQGFATMPENHMGIMRDLAKVYKEVKGDA